MTKVRLPVNPLPGFIATFGSGNTLKLLALLACLLVSACGGGLYGTGTGEETVAVDPNTSDTLGTDLPAQPAPTDPETNEPIITDVPEQPDTTDPDTGDSMTTDLPEQPATTEPDPGESNSTDMPGQPTTTEPDSEGNGVSAAPEPDEAFNEPLSFTNLEPAGNASPPLVKLVNLSTSNINVQLGANLQMLFEADVLPGSSSESVSLPEGNSSLSIFDTAMAGRSVILDPVLVGSDTLSTLIVLDKLTSASAESESALLAIPLTTRSSTNAPGVALVRLVSATGIQDSQQLPNVIFEPMGANPGASEINFTFTGTNTVSKVLVTEYQLVSPGDYVLNNVSQDPEPLTVSLSAQTVYTFILTGDDANVLYTEIDGQP